MKKELVLFLDFDGVFHHIFPLKNQTDEQNSLFYYTSNVEKACSTLKESFDLKIVFATSWKEKFSFEDLKGFFEDYPAIYSSIYSATPNIKGLKDEGYKWEEAKVWLEKNQYNGEFIILDDNEEVWKINGECNPSLILCDDKFDEKEMEKINNLFMIKKPKLKM